ncbi:MAG: hypothetical protein ACSLE0_09595, partial [Chitinophagaceae bacterium]
CLRQKTITMGKDEFERIASDVIKIIQKQPVQIKDLFLRLNNIKKEKAWKVIEFLQAENKIEIKADGQIRQK